jgi:hypothetical protein
MLRLFLLVLVAGLAGTYAIRQLDRRRLELVAQIRAAFLAGLNESADAPAALKDVHVRNATLRFRVPQAWTEEYRDDESGRFQARASRRALDVRTTTLPASLTGIAEVLRARAQGLGPTTVETLPSGDILLKALSEGREGSDPTASFVWLLGRSISAEHVRLATFTFSAPLATAHDVLTRNEVIRLEHEVRAAQLA